MSAIYVPIISEEEYHLFRDIGAVNQFPMNYSGFLELVDKEIEEATSTGIPIFKMNIDFTGFIKWFNSSRYATYRDLLNYIMFTAKAK